MTPAGADAGLDNDALLARLRSRLATGEDPVAVLDGAFRGRTCLVVSAGPSFRHWRWAHHQVSDEEPLVVCVKQTLLQVGELCDVHFVNPYNHRRYAGIDGDRLVVFTAMGSGGPRTFGHRDVTFRVAKAPGAGLEDTLAVRRDFAAWELASSGVARPWGPGIMHESVLYTLLHMGVRRVVTCGWDVADPAGGNRHYYDQRRRRPDPLRTLERLASRVPGLRTAVRLALHTLGRTYNSPTVLPGEAEAVSASLGELLGWLERRGMEVRLITDSPWIHAACPEFLWHLQPEASEGGGSGATP